MQTYPELILVKNDLEPKAGTVVSKWTSEVASLKGAAGKSISMSKGSD